MVLPGMIDVTRRICTYCDSSCFFAGQIPILGIIAAFTTDARASCICTVLYSRRRRSVGHHKTDKACLGAGN